MIYDDEMDSFNLWDMLKKVKRKIKKNNAKQEKTTGKQRKNTSINTKVAVPQARLLLVLFCCPCGLLLLFHFWFFQRKNKMETHMKQNKHKKQQLAFFRVCSN